VGAFLLLGALFAPLVSSFLDAGLVKAIGWEKRLLAALVWLRVLSNVLAG